MASRAAMQQIFAVGIFLAMASTSWGQTVNIMSDTTWRTTNPKPAAGWNTDPDFNDSGWEFAVKDTKNNNHIWYESILSDQAPANAWFRKVFTLDQPLSSSLGIFTLDDNGQVYINGNQIIDDNGSGASSFNLTIDPTLFNVGENLIAVHGMDLEGPDHTIGVNLTMVVPEPAWCGIMGLAMIFVARRRSAGANHVEMH